ncbi:MAG TPA: type II secretion system F family protein [Armatimonadota bacterium]|jgi:tight adherence protein C
MYLLIGLLVFAALAVLVVGLVGESRAVRVGERLQAVQQQSRIIVRGTSLDSALSKSFFDRVVMPQFSKLRERIMGLAPSEMVQTTRRRLDRAGNPPGLPVATFISMRFFSMMAGTLGALLLGMLWNGGLLVRLTLALCIMAVGFIGPDYLVEGKIRTRQATIRKSLPDLIDLLVVSTEAGSGLDGALSVVIKRKRGPLPDEFRRLLTEVRLGKARQDAWADLGDRVGIQDLQMMIAALRQAEQLGVSIANTLRTQADALRTRRSMAIRQAAATLSVKMLFPLIFCILPALFIVVLGPGLMSLATGFSSIGW